MAQTILNFNPKKITKTLVNVLPERARNIIVKRYGLDDSDIKSTLESIGNQYGITRERVRQIEDHALHAIRKSDAYKKVEAELADLKKAIDALGSIISEEHLLDSLTKQKSARNHTHFLLVVGDDFEHRREDEHLHRRWAINSELALKVENSIKKIYSSLSDDEIIPENEIMKSFLKYLEGVADKYKDEEVLKRWLSMSKKIGRNPLGEWGRSDSPNIGVKGIRDYAFLVMRKHGSPIHFTEVAQQIEKYFGKKAHVATCHNELIKDPRFVLVGRGLYALSDWGYSNGVVRDVIREIIKKHGPLTKEQVIEKVLKERYVKENTILVNLQNSKNFKKDPKGRYTLA